MRRARLFLTSPLLVRAAVHARLAKDKLSHLVEPFDVTRYNTNASLAENLLFGTPVGPAFAMEELASNTYVQHVLDKAGLADRRAGRTAQDRL